MDKLRKAALKDLRYDLSLLLIGRPKDSRVGICGQVRIGTGIRRYLNYCFISWPKFSGNISYPVPAPNYISYPDHEATIRAYRIYRDVQRSGGNMWTGAYGELRLELVRFIIQCIDEDLRCEQD